jgi:hypothetical protein
MESQIDENALLVFMDECGDHSVERIDPDFPILLLAFGKRDGVRPLPKHPDTKPALNLSF